MAVSYDRLFHLLINRKMTNSQLYNGSVVKTKI